MNELVWHKAAVVSDFAMQPCLPVIIAGHAILLVQWRDHVYAYANNCPHENLPLTGALIEQDELVCPHHGARFCIANGVVMAPPAFEDLETFPVKLENQNIYVGIYNEF